MTWISSFEYKGADALDNIDLQIQKYFVDDQISIVR
jgi:hypothetical protein